MNWVKGFYPNWTLFVNRDRVNLLQIEMIITFKIRVRFGLDFDFWVRVYVYPIFKKKIKSIIFDKKAALSFRIPM